MDVSDPMKVSSYEGQSLQKDSQNQSHHLRPIDLINYILTSTDWYSIKSKLSIPIKERSPVRESRLTNYNMCKLQCQVPAFPKQAIHAIPLSHPPTRANQQSADRTTPPEPSNSTLNIYIQIKMLLRRSTRQLPLSSRIFSSLRSAPARRTLTSTPVTFNSVQPQQPSAYRQGVCFSSMSLSEGFK